MDSQDPAEAEEQPRGTRPRDCCEQSLLEGTQLTEREVLGAQVLAEKPGKGLKTQQPVWRRGPHRTWGAFR